MFSPCKSVYIFSFYPVTLFSPFFSVFNSFAHQTFRPSTVDFGGLPLPVHHGHAVAQLRQPGHCTRAAYQDTGTHTEGYRHTCKHMHMRGGRRCMTFPHKFKHDVVTRQFSW